MLWMGFTLNQPKLGFGWLLWLLNPPNEPKQLIGTYLTQHVDILPFNCSLAAILKPNNAILLKVWMFWWNLQNKIKMAILAIMLAEDINFMVGHISVHPNTLGLWWQLRQKYPQFLQCVHMVLIFQIPHHRYLPFALTKLDWE